MMRGAYAKLRLPAMVNYTGALPRRVSSVWGEASQPLGEMGENHNVGAIALGAKDHDSISTVGWHVYPCLPRSARRPASVMCTRVTSIGWPPARTRSLCAVAKPARTMLPNSSTVNPCANKNASVQPCRALPASNSRTRRASLVRRGRVGFLDGYAGDTAGRLLSCLGHSNLQVEHLGVHRYPENPSL